jgi:hypothetical protein
MRSTLALLLVSTSLLSGCAVVSVASTAVGIVGTAAGVVVDATVGTVKVVGGAVMPSGSGSK